MRSHVGDGLLQSSVIVAGAGVTYRMLDYWVRVGALAPEVGADGSGSLRLWTADQAATVRVLASLSRMGAKAPVLTLVRLALEADGRLWLGSLLVTADGSVVAYTGDGIPEQGAWLVNAASARVAVAGPVIVP